MSIRNLHARYDSCSNPSHANGDRCKYSMFIAQLYINKVVLQNSPMLIDNPQTFWSFVVYSSSQFSQEQPLGQWNHQGLQEQGLTSTKARSDIHKSKIQYPQGKSKIPNPQGKREAQSPWDKGKLWSPQNEVQSPQSKTKVQSPQSQRGCTGEANSCLLQSPLPLHLAK